MMHSADTDAIRSGTRPNAIVSRTMSSNDSGVEWDFAGLVEGDHWCLCAERWLEAAKAGRAPPVVLEATHEKSLDVVPFELLKKHAAPPA